VYVLATPTKWRDMERHRGVAGRLESPCLPQVLIIHPERLGVLGPRASRRIGPRPAISLSLLGAALGSKVSAKWRSGGPAPFRFHRHKAPIINGFRSKGFSSYHGKWRFRASQKAPFFAIF
jgi:hypothetical protein